jgi:hypothetical protein
MTLNTARSHPTGGREVLPGSLFIMKYSTHEIYKIINILTFISQISLCLTKKNFSVLRVKDLDVILPLKRGKEEESSVASVVRGTGFVIDTRNVIGFEDP